MDVLAAEKRRLAEMEEDLNEQKQFMEDLEAIKELEQNNAARIARARSSAAITTPAYPMVSFGDLYSEHMLNPARLKGQT